MDKKIYIRPELFEFLTELKRNNNREWFQAHKSLYEEHVREPLLSLIEDFRIRLYSISPHFVADTRKTGGSLFRIYRDIRFSRDKSPYKTAAGIQFRHERGKDAHAPGFYFHLEPQNVFVGLGVWHPDSRVLLKIRKAIVKREEDWKGLFSDSTFSKYFQIGGDSLKRAPKGFDADHPLIDHLKKKDFVVFSSIEQEETYREDFLDRLEFLYRTGAPYMRFLTRALGFEW